MPRIVSIDFDRPETLQAAAIQSTLQADGVIAYPTDTLYGLGAHFWNLRAIERIFAAKRRAADKPLLLLIHSLEQASQLAAEISPAARQLMQELWPGPLTLIFKARADLPSNLTASTGKIGLRLPACGFTRRLLEYIGHPLTATSANISGSAVPRTPEDIAAVFAGKIDLVITGGGPPGALESTVLDTTSSPPRLLREGAVARAQIEHALQAAITAV